MWYRRWHPVWDIVDDADLQPTELIVRCFEMDKTYFRTIYPREKNEEFDYARRG